MCVFLSQDFASQQFKEINQICFGKFVGDIGIGKYNFFYQLCANVTSHQPPTISPYKIKGKFTFELKNEKIVLIDQNVNTTTEFCRVDIGCREVTFNVKYYLKPIEEIEAHTTNLMVNLLELKSLSLKMPQVPLREMIFRGLDKGIGWTHMNGYETIGNYLDEYLKKHITSLDFDFALETIEELMYTSDVTQDWDKYIDDLS